MLNIKRISQDLQDKNTHLFISEVNLIKKIYNKLISFDEKEYGFLKLWKNDIDFIYGDVDSLSTANNKVKPDIIFSKYDLTYSAGSKVSMLLYSIQIFYSALIKIVSASAVSSDDSEDLKRILSGKTFVEHGIKNYCYDDYYNWIIYFDAIFNDFEILKNFLFNEYNENKDIISFLENDFIKKIYEVVIPKEFRHILGEYYTPDWMAEYTITKTIEFYNHSYDENLTILDPTCGSGTFIFKALEKMPSASVLQGNVRGYDINPLAILTAKTNYIISAIKKGITTFNGFIIPIFCFDTINYPKLIDHYYHIDLNIDDDILIPSELFESTNCINEIERIISLLDESNKKINSKILFPKTFELLNQTEKKSILRLVENRVMGYKLSKNDFVIGNPPWINWEYLPGKYKRRSNYLWYDYGLFDAKGRDLSFSKEDISVLISYLVLDKYLKSNGILSFVIRQAMFKSASNGTSFRKFVLGNTNENMRVLRVDDFSKIKVFDNASNSTSIMFIQKNEINTYPVKYYTWEKISNGFNSYSSIKEVEKCLTSKELIATPAIKEDNTSMWVTIDADLVEMSKKILGHNNYKARTGTFTGGANAVYWVKIIKEIDENHVLIENVVERAKRKADNFQAIVEKALLYPMIQGSTVDQWSYNNKIYLLCPHNAVTKMKPIEIEEMKEKYPDTYAYLLHFKEFLDGRNGFAGWEKELQKQYFYSILRIGDYTFSKYKVGWKYIATEFISCVIENANDSYLGVKSYLPNEKIMYVSLENGNEAYYLCGILSSIQVSTVIKSFMNPTSISAHVLEKINIPDFDAECPLHMQIAKVCKEGHIALDKSKYKKELNKLISELYHLEPMVLEHLEK